MIEIERDCLILLDRAFMGQNICAFGEDGCGEHGRQPQAEWYIVDGYSVSIYEVGCAGAVTLYLRGYNSEKTGHISTDLNFKIRCKELLAKAGIDPECLSWGAIEDQPRDGVLMKADIPRLLGWM